NRPVMLTLLFPESLPSRARQQFCARFLREAPALAEVRHPHLVPLYAYGEWEGLSYMVNPALPERSLATILRQQGCCAPATALAILEQITAGLEHAHCRGWVHGALALSQLLVSKDQHIQIAGLGLQHLLERRGILPVAAPYEHVLTLAGTWLVAPRYLAPECVQRGQAADIRSDVYSLGVILYELLTGTPAQREMSSLEAMMEEEEHLLPLRPTQDVTLPRSLERVLQQALAEDPAMRFQRVSDLLAAFAEGLEEERSSTMANCWLCPLLPPVGTTGPVALPRMQENEILDPTHHFWERQHTSAPVEASPLFSRFRSWRQRFKRFSARRHAIARKGRLGVQRSRKMRRRQMLGQLVKGVALGALGTGIVSSGYLLSTTLLKRPLPPGSSRSSQHQALNSAQVFTNSGDGRQGLLVHLPDGTFVAYERACTHQGVYVDYDSKTHLLVCPAHGAVFDPAHGGRVVQGPAPRRLPQLPVHTRSDGTLLIGDGGAPPPRQ
ncbi:MAG: protein kinase domain-containing protein, partial [Ktedonobacteraceae bacterium]